MHEQKQTPSPGPDTKSGRRAGHRKPRRAAQGARPAGHARQPGHSLAGYSRDWAGQDGRGLSSPAERRGGAGAGASGLTGASAEGISLRHTAAAYHTAAQDAAGERADAGGVFGLGEVERGGGNGGRRRHRTDRDAFTEGAARAAKKTRGNVEVTVSAGATSIARRPAPAAGISTRNSINVAVVGATGYAGFELATLLLRHPGVHGATFYLRDAHHGVHCLTQLYPQLRGRGDAPCVPFSVEAIAQSDAEVVFLCTPHEASIKLVPELLAADADLRVVDLSGAFRFRDAQVFSDWYKLEAPEGKALSEAVYGLPELYSEDLQQARVVANPGCYPTSVILGLRPLVKAGWIDARRGIVCDCKSGVSGAGKEPKPETHFVSVSENFRAYGVFTARHRIRLQTRRERGREGTQTRNAFRFGERKFPRLRRFHPPAYSGSAAASWTRVRKFHLHHAFAAGRTWNSFFALRVARLRA